MLFQETAHALEQLSDFSPIVFRSTAERKWRGKSFTDLLEYLFERPPSHHRGTDSVPIG